MDFAAPHTNLKYLLRDNRGVTGLYFIAALSATLILAIAALDLIRVHLVRSRIWAAADAALLAAGGSLGTTSWRNIGTSYFNANMGESYMGTNVTVAANDFVEGGTVATGLTVSLTVNASVPLLSVGFLKIADIDISTSSTAQRQGRVAEVAMVLDNTGSMSGTKLSTMKVSATSLVDTLVGPNSGGNSSVGLVPFNETVRVSKTGWLENGSTTPLSAAQWDGCVFERKDSADAFIFDATPPSSTKFTAYTRTRCKGGSCDKVTENNQVGCVTAPVAFLSANQTALDTAITNMVADGSTMVAGGLVWGWRMLSPNWRGTGTDFWGSATLPQDADPSLQKVIILLTDGDNAVSITTDKYNYTYYRSPFGDAEHVTYHDPSDSSTTYSSINITGNKDGDANDLLARTCTAVKSDGIDIYAITFGTSVSQTTATLMRNCATDPSYYYNAPTSGALSDVFDNIGSRLSELKLVK